MKTKLMKMTAFLAAAFSLMSATAQGLFIYDQQSAVEPRGGESAGFLQTEQPLGQSFTPGSNSVSFIRLLLSDMRPDNGLGATVYINLRSNSIAGPVIASTDPVFMPDNFGTTTLGYTNFFFATSVPVTPGLTYYFQPVTQSGDPWAVIADTKYNYQGGTMYVNGVPPQFGNFDLWFREGIYVVPEPSSAALVMAGSGILFYVRRAKNRR
jgi:hypothetical protein